MVIGAIVSTPALALAQDTIRQHADDAVQAAQDSGAQLVEHSRVAIQSDPWFWGNVLAAAAILAFLFARGVLRPRGLASSPRKVSEHGALTWFACAGMIFLVQQVSLAMAIAAGVSATAADPRSRAVLMLAGSLAGLAAGLVLIRLLRASSPGSGLQLRAADLPMGLLCGVAAFPVAQSAGFAAVALSDALGGKHQTIAHEALSTILDHTDDPWTWALAGVAVLVAPVVEEILYRGCLQTGLLRATGRPGLSVLATSLLFTFAHLGVGPWYGLVPIFALSLGLGIALERTKSLLIPIAMHALFNAANLALALLTPQN